MTVATDQAMQNGASTKSHFCITHKNYFPDEPGLRPFEEFGALTKQYCKRCMGKRSAEGREGKGRDQMTIAATSTQGTPVATALPTLQPGTWAEEPIEKPEEEPTEEPTPATEDDSALRMRPSRIQELLAALRSSEGHPSYLQIGEVLLAPGPGKSWSVMRRDAHNPRTIGVAELVVALELVLEVATSEAPLIRFG